MILGVTEAFWKLCGVSFSGATLPFGNFLFLCCRFSRGLGDFFSGNGVWLRSLLGRNKQLRVMDFKPAQGGSCSATCKRRWENWRRLKRPLEKLWRSAGAWLSAVESKPATFFV
jgi:hypothetical protein